MLGMIRLHVSFLTHINAGVSLYPGHRAALLSLAFPWAIASLSAEIPRVTLDLGTRSVLELSCTGWIWPALCSLSSFLRGEGTFVLFLFYFNFLQCYLKTFGTGGLGAFSASNELLTRESLPGME